MTEPFTFVPAARLANVAPSATLALAQRAREMRAQGHDVVSLTAGEPDFVPPRHVIDAAQDAMSRGLARYTAVPGIPELRDAVAAQQLAFDGVRWTRDEIVVSTGAKQAIANTLGACVDPGHEVVIVAPYWLSYVDMTHLVGGVPVLITTRDDEGFALSPEALERALTPRTRMVILNSPSNPAGACYSREAWRGIAEVLRRHPHVLVMLDDIYRRLYFGDAPIAPSLLHVAPDLQSRCIVIDGCSKTYAMTGYRLGWSAAPKAISSMIARVQGQTTSSAPAASQYAALAALTGDQGWVTDMTRTYDRRRQVVIAGLRQIEGLSCFDPGGAFYAFPNVRRWIGCTLPSGRRVDDVATLVEHLLVDHHVATVPGAPFGAPEHLRLSFAIDIPELQKALARMALALDSLR